MRKKKVQITRVDGVVQGYVVGSDAAPPEVAPEIPDAPDDAGAETDPMSEATKTYSRQFGRLARGKKNGPPTKNGTRGSWPVPRDSEGRPPRAPGNHSGPAAEKFHAAVQEANKYRFWSPTLGWLNKPAILPSTRRKRKEAYEAVARARYDFSVATLKDAQELRDDAYEKLWGRDPVNQQWKSYKSSEDKE